MRLFAKKSLGQHFLNSPHVLHKIIEAASVIPGQDVLEIGPGTGILTRALLDAGARVTAVEKDPRAISVLRETFVQEISNGSLILKEGDILKTGQMEEIGEGENSFSLIANIPYYITGAILEKFLETGPRPDKMVLLVQKEVAERIVARNSKESILSISVKAFGTPRLVATVPPGAFTPPPSVDSAILEISGISDKNFATRDIDIRNFFGLVKTGFAHKRKRAFSNISELIGKDRAEKVWAALNLDPNVRAEDISVDMWLSIASFHD